MSLRRVSGVCGWRNKASRRAPSSANSSYAMPLPGCGRGCILGAPIRIRPYTPPPRAIPCWGTTSTEPPPPRCAPDRPGPSACAPACRKGSPALAGDEPVRVGACAGLVLHRLGGVCKPWRPMLPKAWTSREPLNKSRSPSAPLFAGGDGVAAMAGQPAARRGFRSPCAAGRPSGGPAGRAGCVAAPCVGPRPPAKEVAGALGAGLGKRQIEECLFRLCLGVRGG